MTPLEATVFAPGVIATLVGVAELRSNMSRVAKARNVVPVFLTLVLVVVFLLLERVIDVTSPSMPWLARCMASLAAIVGISGVLIRYSRRSNAILMAVAGFMLVVYWTFFSIPRP
jgi:cytochrome bd-type quinol oxidase subunit 2